MFLSNRFIAAGLLVFYGIPMAAGPSWHRHDSGCDASACQLTGVVGALDEERHDHSSDHAHDHKHDHGSGHVAGAVHDGALHEGALQHDTSGSGDPLVHNHGPSARALDNGCGSLQTTDTHGPCAVCAFYTQSQLAGRVVEQAADEALLYSLATTYLSVGPTAYAECQPRGPPMRSFL